MKKGTPIDSIGLRPSDEYLLDSDAPLPSDKTLREHLLASPAGVRRLAREREREQRERERADRQRLQQAAQQAECQRLQQAAQQAERQRLQQAAQQAERERQQAERERQQAVEQADRERQQAVEQAELERQQADLLLQITKGDIKHILSLIRKGETDLTLTNSDEETAFHLASRLGQRGVLLALFQAGADPECINIHGDRPVDLAKDGATRKCFHNAPRRSVNPSGPQQSVSPPRTRPGPPLFHPVSNTLPGTHRSVPPRGTNPFMGAERFESSRPPTQHSSSSPRAPIAQASADTAVPNRDIATSLAKLKQFASETSKYHGNNGTVVALRWLDKALASETPYDPAQLREYVRIVSELAADQSRRLHDADPANTKPTIRWSEHHGLSPETSRAKVVEDMKSAHAVADADPNVPLHVTFNTGKGNNSQVQGDPVIRPMVEQMLGNYERIPDPNSGLVIVRVRPNTPNRVRE
ncbi:g9331 [Coccomyxa viridis]|uniref:G9331 protein n=1 Tax=Coccomyxa viridis TaxID=1274662 RepID=A0ABP1G2Y5_9CHLO